MRVLLLTSSFPAGPDDPIQAPFILPIAEELGQRGHHVTVLTHAKPSSSSWIKPSFELCVFNSGTSRRVGELQPGRPREAWALGRYLVRGYRAIKDLMNRQRPDIMVAFWFVPSGLWASLLGPWRGVPFIVWALGSDIRLLRRLPGGRLLMRHIGRKAAHVFADGESLIDALGEAGVEADFLSSARSLQPSSSKLLSPCDFVFIGRLSFVKGVDVFARAVEIVALCRPVRAHIIGDGDMIETLRALDAVRTGILTLEGAMPPDKISSRLATHPCVVISSRAESLPLVLTEAVEAGCPLIVSDVGDMGATVRQYRLGNVVPAEDPEALARTMIEHLDGRVELSVQGAEAFLSRMDPRASRRRLIETMESMARL